MGLRGVGRLFIVVAWELVMGVFGNLGDGVDDGYVYGYECGCLACFCLGVWAWF